MPVLPPLGAQAAAGAAPCGWVIDTSCCPAWSSYTVPQQELATAWASEILWALSGRRYGLCQVTVRPCYTRCQPRSYQTWGVWMDSGWGDGQHTWWPYVDPGGEWRNCGCPGVCCCGASCEVVLPGPVGAIVEVRVDNVLIPSSAYRVDNGELLVRQDGDCWPECNNLDVPASSTDRTFIVVYTRGEPLPVGGQVAAGALACEFSRACAAGDCTMPERVSSITRQGVSMELIAAEDEFSEYRTGLVTADRWLTSVNPNKLKQRPRVSNLDLPQPRITTWTA